MLDWLLGPSKKELRAEICKLNRMRDKLYDENRNLDDRVVRDGRRIQDLQRENFNLDKINDIKDREISGYRDELEPLKQENVELKGRLRRQSERTMLEWDRAEAAEARIARLYTAFGYEAPITTNEV